MKINFNGFYKSLSSFTSEELPDFTVITGKNGSGKSQLISCIKNPIGALITPRESYELQFIPNEKNVTVGELIYLSKGPGTSDLLNTVMVQYEKLYQELHTPGLEIFSILHKKNKKIEELSLEDFNDALSGNLKLDLLNQVLQRTGYSGNVRLSDEKNLKQLKIGLTRYQKLFDLLKIIADSQQIDILEITPNDFTSTSFPERVFDSADLIQSKIETIFYAYLKRKFDNTVRSIINQRDGTSYDVIPLENYDKIFPAPWNIINDILKKNFPNLKIKTFNELDFKEGARLEIFFQKDGIKNLIRLDGLSSGEQIIIGLILKLFTKEFYQGEITTPKILVLDEPDAFLHPEMSNLLINVLVDTFVKELGIKVIITTHSPSTIALSPEDSIFEMSNQFRKCSLTKINKDDALALLTANIPTLSIDYRNHRHVCVESDTDIDYYQKLLHRVVAVEQLNYKLYFISNQRGKSNSDWVKRIVPQLRSGGNQKAFGIMDWDLTRKAASSVFVHGEGIRYSLETIFTIPYIWQFFLLKGKRIISLMNYK